eukprot:m.353432 g.353432  ORF g.353432 m.353432 type:complete len:217 (-) comp16765_c0_seq1:3684-4334(-)
MSVSFFAAVDDVELTSSESESEAGDERVRGGDSSKASAKDTTETQSKRSKVVLPSVDDLLGDDKFSNPEFLHCGPQALAKEDEVKSFDHRNPEKPKTPWMKTPDQIAADRARKEEARRQQIQANSGAANDITAAANALRTTYSHTDYEAVGEGGATPISQLNKKQKPQGVKAHKKDIEKVESFQQKERRKRNMGQSSKDASFVEEEKRVLRQTFDQ